MPPLRVFTCKAKPNSRALLFYWFTFIIPTRKKIDPTLWHTYISRLETECCVWFGSSIGRDGGVFFHYYKNHTFIFGINFRVITIQVLQFQGEYVNQAFFRLPVISLIVDNWLITYVKLNENWMDVCMYLKSSNHNNNANPSTNKHSSIPHRRFFFIQKWSKYWLLVAQKSNRKLF